MTQVVTREEFDQMKCAGCDNHDHDDEIYLHARCHPQSPTWTFYQDGTMTVECAECRKPIVRVEIR